MNSPLPAIVCLSIVITLILLTSLGTEAENTALKDAVQREAMRYHAIQLQAQ
jgi:hypothetical protein